MQNKIGYDKNANKIAESFSCKFQTVTALQLLGCNLRTYLQSFVFFRHIVCEKMELVTLIIMRSYDQKCSQKCFHLKKANLKNTLRVSSTFRFVLLIKYLIFLHVFCDLYRTSKNRKFHFHLKIYWFRTEQLYRKHFSQFLNQQKSKVVRKNRVVIILRIFF